MSTTVVLTPEQIEALRALLGDAPIAAAPVKASKPKATPAWLVARGERKAQRRALAAQMRAAGIALTPEAWSEAKKSAGIAAAERKAHAAFARKAK